MDGRVPTSQVASADLNVTEELSLEEPSPEEPSLRGSDTAVQAQALAPEAPDPALITAHCENLLDTAQSSHRSDLQAQLISMQPPELNAEALAQLSAFGFSESAAANGLRHSRGDVQAAVDWILANEEVANRPATPSPEVLALEQTIATLDDKAAVAKPAFVALCESLHETHGVDPLRPTITTPATKPESLSAPMLDRLHQELVAALLTAGKGGSVAVTGPVGDVGTIDVSGAGMGEVNGLYQESPPTMCEDGRPHATIWWREDAPIVITSPAISPSLFARGGGQSYWFILRISDATRLEHWRERLRTGLPIAEREIRALFTQRNDHLYYTEASGDSVPDSWRNAPGGQRPAPHVQRVPQARPAQNEPLADRLAALRRGRALHDEGDDTDNEENHEGAQRRGACSICGRGVWSDQRRVRDGDGADASYAHRSCQENRDGSTDSHTPDDQDHHPGATRRGSCAICGRGVWTDESRNRNGDGSYEHQSCAEDGEEDEEDDDDDEEEEEEDEEEDEGGETDADVEADTLIARLERLR